MGCKYTIKAGRGEAIAFTHETNNIFVALYTLWNVKIDKKEVWWKTLQVN